ncbi:MAG: hypothetical protein QXJ51_01110 [Sulfolobales archaeon]
MSSVKAEIMRVIATGDQKYDLYVRIHSGGRNYILYMPKLSRKPDGIDLSLEHEKMILKIMSRGEGFCSCTLDLDKLSSGCIIIRCVNPSGMWVIDEELLKAHRIEESK